MSEVIPFSYEGNPFNAVIVDNEPWFVATDLGDTIGLANVASSVAALDDDEKGIHTMDTLGGEQQKLIVSEAGLYSLILRSRKPEAKAFKRWVTHEVLPSIRKRGGYLTPEATEKALTDPDFIIRLATELKAERAKRAEIEAQQQADRPKVLFADAVAASQTSILIGDLAKILRQNGVDMGQKRLFEALRNDGYLISRKGSDWNSPTQRAMEMGIFEVKETAITHSDGHVTISKTTKVTGKGQAYFIARFLDGRLPKAVAA